MNTTPPEVAGERRILANAGWLMLSQVVTWSISSVQAIVLPRHFGAETAGHLHIALSLWAIAGLFVSFGTDLTLSRRVARGEADLDTVVGTTIGLRVAFHLVAFGVLAGFVTAVGYATPVLTAVAIYGVAQLLLQTSGVFETALYGLEHMKTVSGVRIAVRLVRTSLVLSLVIAGLAFEQVILSSIVAGAFAFVLRWRALRRVRRVRLRFDRPVARELLRESRPLLLNRLARNLYTQLDVVLISLLVSETVVGWYVAGDILFGTLLFVPNIVGAAVFPALSRLYVSDAESGSRVTRRIFHLLMALVIPLGFGVVAIAQPLVDLLFGSNFSDSGTVLMVFGIVVTLTSLNTVLGQQLIARNQERPLTRVMVVAVVIAVPVDIALIWWTQAEFENGAIGAALAFVATEAIILVGSVRLLPDGTLDRETAWLAVRIVAAAMVMLAVAWSLRDQFIVVPIVAGAAVYAALAVPARVVSAEDRVFLRSLATRSATKDASR